MVLRLAQIEWRRDMSSKHRCFRKFINSLNAESSRETYGYKFQKFMKWAVSEKLVKHTEDFEGLLKLDSEKITDVLEDYVNFMEQRGDISIGTDLASPELFFQMNRKIWHRELVRKGIRKKDRMKGGGLPIEDQELEDVYSSAKTLREKCIISVLSSLGIRPGAIIDPVIRFKHLIPIEDSYAVKIYDDSDEGYWSILIPEARKDVDRYKASRIRNGENVTDESPVLATLPSRWNAKRDYMTDDNLKEILARLIRDKVKRKKIGNRYNKAIVYMFRKRFNTKLKLNNDVNSNIAELVMAHKLPGVQDTYTKPTMKEVYNAMKHAIPDLTIDSTERQKIDLESKQKKITELESKQKENDSLKHKISDLEIKIGSMAGRSNMTTIPISDLTSKLKKLLKENPELLQIT